MTIQEKFITTETPTVLPLTELTESDLISKSFSTETNPLKSNFKNDLNLPNESPEEEIRKFSKLDTPNKFFMDLEFTKYIYIIFLKFLNFNLNARPVAYDGHKESEVYTKSSPRFHKGLQFKFWSSADTGHLNKSNSVALPSYEDNRVLAVDIDGSKYTNTINGQKTLDKESIRTDILKFNKFLNCEPIYCEYNINKEGHFHLYYLWGKTIHNNIFKITDEQIKEIFRYLELNKWELRTIKKALSLPLNPAGYRPCKINFKTLSIERIEDCDVRNYIIDLIQTKNTNEISVDYYYNNALGEIREARRIELCESNISMFEISRKENSSIDKKSLSYSKEIETLKFFEGDRHNKMMKLANSMISREKTFNEFLDEVSRKQVSSKDIKKWKQKGIFETQCKKIWEYCNKNFKPRDFTVTNDKRKKEFVSNKELVDIKYRNAIENYFTFHYRTKNEKQRKGFILFTIEAIGKHFYDKQSGMNKKISNAVRLKKEMRKMLEETMQLTMADFFKKIADQNGLGINFYKNLYSPYIKFLCNESEFFITIVSTSYSYTNGLNYGRSFTVNFDFLNNYISKMSP